MKKIILFSFLSLAAMTGCKKSNDVKPGSASIIGSWELRNYSGTIAGVNINVPNNSGNNLIFHSDSTFERYTDRKLTSSGKFSVTPNGKKAGTTYYNVLHFADGSEDNYYVIKNDTLTITDFNADGITSILVRVN